MDTQMALSLVVPLYNNEATLRELDAELNGFLPSLGLPYEILYVDNGSNDSTPHILKQLAADPDGVRRALILRRDFGETAAISAGLDHVRGEIIITYSSDLSSDPVDIPRFLEAIETGYDVVSGRRRGFSDTLFRRVANRGISAITRLRLRDYGALFCAYRRDIIKDVRVYGELFMYYPVFAMEAGAHVTEIDTVHRSDRFASTPFSPKRYFKMLLDLLNVWFLSRYSVRPLYVFGAIGTALAAIGFVILILLLAGVKSIFVTSTLTIILVILGVQTVLFGLSTELIVRTIYLARSEPLYKIRTRL